MLSNNQTIWLIKKILQIMNAKLLQILTDLSLSLNEAKLYLSGLKLGATTILSLSRDSEIKRSTVYGVVETLKQKGLCNKQLNGWKKLFVMSNPNQLKNILEQRKQELESILPEFELITNPKKTEDKIEYYSGLKGVKNIYNQLLISTNSNSFQYIIGDLSYWYELDAGWFEEYIKTRSKLTAQQKYSTKAIFRNSKPAIQNKKLQKSLNMKIKLTDIDNDISNIIITDDMIVIQQLKTPIHCIVIKNKGAIKVQKEMFEMLWKRL